MNAAQDVLPAPSIEYAQLSPMLIVFAVAVVAVLVEAFAPGRLRYTLQLVLSVGGLVAAFIAVVALAGTQESVAVGAVAVDGPALFMQGTILVVSALSIPLVAQRTIAGVRVGAGVGAAAGGQTKSLDAFTSQASTVPGSEPERKAGAAGLAQTEVFPLMMFAVGGMLLFPASNDLLTMFVALEVLSLPLYLMCGLARRRRLLSQEAALKYFLLGAFSSAFFLFGAAFLYGYAGSVDFRQIAAAIDAESGDRTLALIGAGLVSIGLLFKIGAVPFHYWIPDVYQGAPTPVTAFMAAATKIAAFGAMLRLFYVALPGLKDDWRPALWVIAILTMVIASVVAITQTDMKRMLAYSSVAHAGFILTGVIAINRAGLSSTMFYLVAYGFSTVGAFAVVTLVRDRAGEVTEMSRWAGLGRRSPLLAGVFAMFLLAFAGIPLTSGFVSKFAVFQAAASGGAVPLVIVGVLSSAIAVVFYVRVIVLMFFSEPPVENAPTVVVPNVATIAAIALAAVVTVGLGVAPQPLLDLADQAAVFLR
jgi:NADH-quinone oxidoreductase subunit N